MRLPLVALALCVAYVLGAFTSRAWVDHVVLEHIPVRLEPAGAWRIVHARMDHLSGQLVLQIQAVQESDDL